MDAPTITAYAALLTAVGVIVSSVLSYLGLKQGQRTHHEVNSRMDQMLDLKGKASKAEGVTEERDKKNNDR